MRKILSCSAVGMLVFGLALAACGGGSGGGGSTSAFCDTLKKDKTQFDELNSNNSDTFTNSSALAVVTKAFDDLTAKAPTEIKSDMQKVDQAIKNLTKALPELESAFSKGDFEKASSLDSQFSEQNKDFEQAQKNVEKFAKDKCGIDLNSDSTDSSSSSSSKKSSSSRSSSSSDSFSSLSDFSFNTDSFSSLLSSLSDFSFSS